MLIIQFKDKRLPPVWVVEKLYSIGSAEDNHLVVSDAEIDPLHARIISRADKSFLKDNNSNAGCFVNGQRITNKELFPGDVIRLGRVEFEVLDPQSLHINDARDVADNAWQLISDGNWLSGRTFVVSPGKPIVIGRGAESDIVIPGTHLSRRHTELSVQGKALRIKDLASPNGTFVNDQRIDTVLAESGDRLRLDVYTFRLLGPEEQRDKIRIRSSIEALAKPIERKLASNEPKRWKTRPTSPGNRMEPTYTAHSRKGELWLWAVLTAVVLAFIAAIYLL